MKFFFRRFTKSDYWFFAICGIVYFIWIMMYIPGLDDTFYRFSYKTGERITSVADAIQSQAVCYTSQNFNASHNGRFLVHLFVQLFCGTWGILPFCIISTFCFIMLLMGMTWLVRYRYGRYSSDKYLLITGILFLTPRISLTLLGSIAYIINYVWSAAIYLFFLCIYIYLRDERPSLSVWQIVLLCCFALIAGSWQESFCIGIGGALFLYHIVHIKDTKGVLLYFLICFAIGCCICIFAPANFTRFAGANTSYTEVASPMMSWFATKMYKIKMMVKHCGTVQIDFLLLLLIPLLQRKQTRKFLKDNYLLWMPCVFSIFFAFFIAYTDDHQLFIVGILTIILLIDLLWATFNKSIGRLNKWISIACTVVLLIICIPSLYYRSVFYKEYKVYEDTVKHAEDSVCLSTGLEHIDREVIHNSFYKKYIPLYHYRISLYEHPRFFRVYSRYVSDDYQEHATLALPETKQQIIQHCCEANQLAEYVYDSPVLEYYIIRIPTKWDPSKVMYQEGWSAISPIEKMKDKLKHRKEKTGGTKQVFPDYSHRGTTDTRCFVDGEYRYILETKHPGNRKLSSIKVWYEE